MNPNKKVSPGRRQAPSASQGQLYHHRNEAVFVPDGYIAVGRIATAHGIRGEVRVELHTDFPDRFAPNTVIYISEALSPATIEYARPHKLQMLVKLVGIETRDEAETLRGQWVFVPEDEAVELEADTYWVHDIVGLQAETETGELLGRISEVLFTGANEVYVIQGNDGAELLVPAIADVIQQVDLATKRIIVRLLPGMRDD